MYIPFHQLPSSAKVWVYQSPSKLSDTHKEILNTSLRSFTESWKVHGEPLTASFEIRFDRFVILAAVEGASGCSIDTSVQVIRELGQRLNLDFFDRTQIGFLIDNQIAILPLKEVKGSVQSKVIMPETLFFNNAISTMDELNNSWPAPAQKTWLKRYFQKESVAE